MAELNYCIIVIHIYILITFKEVGSKSVATSLLTGLD